MILIKFKLVVKLEFLDHSNENVRSTKMIIRKSREKSKNSKERLHRLRKRIASGIDSSNFNLTKHHKRVIENGIRDILVNELIDDSYSLKTTQTWPGIFPQNWSSTLDF